MTDVRRVFVVENSTLLGAGIQSLLTREDDLRVVGMTPEDEVALLEDISCFCPDVVVLDEATTDSSRLCALLQGYSELRVIVVSIDDDLVQTYDKGQVVVTRATELVALIRS